MLIRITGSRETPTECPRHEESIQSSFRRYYHCCWSIVPEAGRRRCWYEEKDSRGSRQSPRCGFWIGKVSPDNVLQCDILMGSLAWKKWLVATLELDFCIAWPIPQIADAQRSMFGAFAVNILTEQKKMCKPHPLCCVLVLFACLTITVM